MYGDRLPITITRLVTPEVPHLSYLYRCDIYPGTYCGGDLLEQLVTNVPRMCLKCADKEGNAAGDEDVEDRGRARVGPAASRKKKLHRYDSGMSDCVGLVRRLETLTALTVVI